MLENSSIGENCQRATVTRRVHWQTKGTALRQLQRVSGLEVVELGPLAPGRSYSVRLASLVKPAASCLLTLQPSRVATV